LDIQWWMYAAFIAFVIAMLLVDLKFFHTEGTEPTMKESATWVGVWVTLAVLFGIGVLVQEGPHVAAEYFTGYIVEYSLSVDNMFVFVVIFSYFRVPFAYQHQVLFWGILGAIIFRGIFIAVANALVTFEIVIPLFGALLIYTAYRIGKGGAENVDPEHNPVLKFAQKRFRTTPRFDGQKLFTVEMGKRLATPLFIVLLIIETTDIVFAVDSIPAIYGITREPFIILTSNVFAVLGLRALYFLLGGAMNRLHLLNYGLAIILGFIGIKMMLELVGIFGPFEVAGMHIEHIEIPIWFSLGLIVVVLAVTTILSLKLPPKEEQPSFSFPTTDEIPQIKSSDDGDSGNGKPDREVSRRQTER
jgi:tellurite resistance protein TerC